MKKTIGVSVLGGTGFGAGEFLRLVLSHPLIEITSITSRSNLGEHISVAHPHLAGFYPELSFTENISFEDLLPYENRFILVALPHGIAGESIAELSQKAAQHETTIIDLSGAYRLKDLSQHNTFYPSVKRSEELAKNSVYGLSELNCEQIITASLVANPGCLATASILALAPIAALIDPQFIAIDAKTGSSGSGKDLKPTTLHSTRNSNFTAYKALQHQHEPEIFQCLQQIGLKVSPTSFLVQSLPVARGIYVSVHIQNKKALGEQELQEAFSTFTENNPTIRLRSQPPHLQHVIGTNFCDISYAVRDETIVVMTAIDNLVKGMAGQALQNINIHSGIDQITGLRTPALRLN